MSRFDLDVAEVLSALAAIVNRAGGAEATSAEAMQVARVPLGLLLRAKDALQLFDGTEFGTESIYQACQRRFK